MAKATVMGCACVVVSDLTPEEITLFERFDPDATVLTQGETSFSLRLDPDNGPGYLREDYATYSRTKSADGRATITIFLDPEAEDKMELVRSRIGASMLKLEKLEKQMVGRRDDLAEMEKNAGMLITQL